jgi:hypothetical protein
MREREPWSEPPALPHALPPLAAALAAALAALPPRAQWPLTPSAEVSDAPSELPRPSELRPPPPDDAEVEVEAHVTSLRHEVDSGMRPPWGAETWPSGKAGGTSLLPGRASRDVGTTRCTSTTPGAPVTAAGGAQYLSTSARCRSSPHLVGVSGGVGVSGCRGALCVVGVEVGVGVGVEVGVGVGVEVGVEVGVGVGLG